MEEGEGVDVDVGDDAVGVKAKCMYYLISTSLVRCV